jgi:carboxymethylenebutenolidase
MTVDGAESVGDITSQTRTPAAPGAAATAGITHDFTVYPGAPHSFLDRKQAEFAEASADAWRRV